MENRREFIKHSCKLCLGGLALGWLTTQLAACSSLPIVKAVNDKGMINVPVSSFTEKNNLVIVRNGELEYDILLVKFGNTYTALQMKCTHQDNPLVVNSTGLFCSVHGSGFDLNGNVTKEPALRPLKKYAIQLNESSILISL
ncbi:MAG TPA: Rieske 2Fe-2S domain-containing protein [Bacteroidia bacterium]|jgi:Rieske Fe-S protein|nr:Rieske 2Fe-2S domain-containing protein [Bacteroidia bacterium]